jgi:HPt (histidine-containing phosphotransfer) domain-containing protein
MEPSDQSAMTEAMDRLWARFLPEMEERVTTLEAAGAALAAGTLTASQREQAIAAAHKLAGVLGTFGLAEGTTLAREAEDFYADDQSANSAADFLPAQNASQLRAMLAARKYPGPL